MLPVGFSAVLLAQHSSHLPLTLPILVFPKVDVDGSV